MAPKKPKVTSSADRSKRTTKKPVTQGQNPQRANRQRVASKMVTRSGAGAVNSPTGSGRVTSSADRRTNLPGGKSNKPAAKPTSARAITNGGSATMKQIRAKAVQARRQAEGKPVRGGTKGRALTTPNSAKTGKNLIKEGAQRMRNLADSGQVRAAAQRGQKIAEAARRNRARLAAGVGKGAVESAAFKSGLKTGGRALLPVAIASQVENVASGFKKIANHPFIKGRPKPATPKPATPKGPTPAQRKDFTAQETKARQSLTARKKAAGSAQATPNTAKSFDDAFKDARRAKVGSFTWRGKKYTTKKAGE